MTKKIFNHEILGKPSEEKNGKSMVFYQTGGVSPPLAKPKKFGNFHFFLARLLAPSRRTVGTQYCAPKTVDVMKYHPYDVLK